MTEESTLKTLLAKYSTIQEFEAGKELYTYNQPANKIYFVIDGLIRIFVRNKKQETEIQRHKTGDFVGESAFAADFYSSRAEVYIKTKLLEFKVSDLRRVMEQNTSFAEKMINHLSHYIERLENIDKINLTPLTELNSQMEIEKEIKETINADNSDNNKRSKTKENQVKKDKNSSFYLNGHQQYDQQTSPEAEYYLYEKEVECPVCSQKMQIKKIRNSRLRIEKIREDLRPIYRDFNLYNYSVLSCSNCLFTARRKDFNSFSKSRRKKIKNNFKKQIHRLLGSYFKIEFSEPRNINQVLDAHYLALKLYDYTNFAADKKAFLWRELSWIYEDLGENELSNKASLNALNNLEEYYFKENSSSSKKESNNLSLLLSVLYYKHKQSDKALTLLDELIRDKKVSIRHRNKARDLFLKIREENNRKK